MKIKFWGVRGSIASPGIDKVRYGGNTTCIEVETDTGDIIILDAGTGIRNLGLELKKKNPLEVSIFITHTHWDHILGFPFFVPIYSSKNKINVYGSYDPINRKSFKDIIDVLMQPDYFPVSFKELKAKINYIDLFHGKRIEISDTTSVTAFHMNHPVLCLGYKVTCNGKSVFFSGDHEPLGNIYKSDEEEYTDYQDYIERQREEFIRFISGVDVLIFDSAYTEDEYGRRVGWGHSTHEKACRIAELSGVKTLFLTHHQTDRSDDELDLIYKEVLEKFGGKGYDIKMAVEGEEFRF